MGITRYEQETIITFNTEEDFAQIYTHDKGWQIHLERKLGLKPVATNPHGGRTYEIDKKRIPKPRAPRRVSQETKVRLTNMARARAKISSLKF